MIYSKDDFDSNDDLARDDEDKKNVDIEINKLRWDLSLSFYHLTSDFTSKKE